MLRYQALSRLICSVACGGCRRMETLLNDQGLTMGRCWRRRHCRGLREVRQNKLIALAHYDGAVDRVLELTDIARPIQLRQVRHRFAADAGDVAVFLGAEPGEEMPHQM